MIICSDGHEEVVSEGRNCVLCMIMEHYEEKIKDLNERIEVLESEVSNVEAFASLGA